MTALVNNRLLYAMVMSPKASMPRARRFTGWLILLCAALLLNGLLAHYSVRRLVALEQSREHLRQRREAFSELDVGILTAQLSGRGYALTGQSGYLSEHSAALSRVHGALATAKQLARGEAQRLQLDRLEAHVMKAMSWVQQLMIARQKGGLDAAERMLADGRGVVFVATARAALAQMDDALQERMRAEIAEISGDLTAAMAYLAVFTVVGILLTLLVVRTVRREFEHREKADQALFGANEMLRTVLDTIPQRVFWKDRSSHFLGSNVLFARDAGFERPDDIVGKTDGHTAFRAHAAAYRADDVRVMAGEARLSREEGVTRPDGDRAWLRSSKVALRDMAGNVIGVLGTYEDITERKAFEQEIERQATTDSLTGLPNRNLLADRIRHVLAQAARSRASVAVAAVDLDHFKVANDAYGRAFGDRLLKETAQRLQAVVRAGDTVARSGDDEFVLLLSCERDELFMGVLERVLETISKPFDADGVPYFCTCSIGASTFPHDGADEATLLTHAEAAMYRAKERGRNRIEVFHAELGRRLQERISIERGLRTALEDGQLVLEYQPQLSLSTNRIRGVEALVRWKHPVDGLVLPGRFIPVAEQSGLIVPIGAWILRSACAQAQKWNEKGLGPLAVAVNLSPLQFRQQGFVQLVADTLFATGLAAAHLELEITESLLMSEADDAVHVLDELGALGICLSIDDFGTGYSSLSYLKRLPVDKLKIDRSFVRDIPGDPDDVAIARAIVSLGHSLDLAVVAEGVETLEQLEFMRSLGCDEIQGYYFSRPVPPEEIGPLVSAQGEPRPG